MNVKYEKMVMSAVNVNLVSHILLKFIILIMLASAFSCKYFATAENVTPTQIENFGQLLCFFLFILTDEPMLAIKYLSADFLI